MKKIIKWAVYCFAAFCAFCILVAVFVDDEKATSNSSKDIQQEERVVNTEAERQAREQKAEAERQAQEQKAEAERLAREQKEKQEKKDKILKDGYDIGYKNAIQYTYKMDHYCRNAYISKYGAPQSDEEIELYKQFVEQYDKGWDAGRKVRDSM